MVTFKIVLAYDGSNFCGWQRQKTTYPASVQAVVEEALAKVLNEKVKITAVSRTDAGVHALNQVAVFQTKAVRTPENILAGLNSLLPKEVRVRSAEVVPHSFHPRYQARQKTYRYLIQTEKVANPLFSSFCCYLPEGLNLLKMRRAASYLLGCHDFAAFQASGRKVRNTVRTISACDIEQLWDSFFYNSQITAITITADGFLYRMVRNIVGTLLEVGQGRLRPSEVKTILERRDRRYAGPTAPAVGLTLWKVEY